MSWIVLWTSLATVFGFLLLRDSSRHGGEPPLLPDDVQQSARKVSGDSSGMRRARHLLHWSWSAILRQARAKDFRPVAMISTRTSPRTL